MPVNNQFIKPIMELKANVKLLKRRKNKAELEKQAAEKKIQEELKKGRPDIARIAAAKAVRKNREVINLEGNINMIEAVVDEVQMAQTSQNTAQVMGKIASVMKKINSKEMGHEQVHNMMENFEVQSGELKLKGQSLTDMMSSTGATASDLSAEDELMKTYSDQLQIDTAARMPAATTSQVKSNDEVENKLSEHLKQIRT